MTTCSKAFALLINLNNAQEDHQKHCTQPCNVSLYMLAEVAEVIYDDVWREERTEAWKIVRTMKDRF
jgi:hypothetical protein